MLAFMSAGSNSTSFSSYIEDVNKVFFNYNQSKAQIHLEAMLQCCSNNIRICKDKIIGLNIFSYISYTHKKSWF